MPLTLRRNATAFRGMGTTWHRNVGVFASMDAVAIDTAIADMIDKAPIGPNSRAEELGLKPGEDKFKAINAFTPRIQLKAGEKCGLGTMKL